MIHRLIHSLLLTLVAPLGLLSVSYAVTITHVPLYTFHGDDLDDGFGFSVSGAGDVNGDGHADVIVGAREDDNNGVSSGRARVLSGVDGSILYDFDGDSANDEFGISVSGAGDVNGDGRADLIVGAHWDDNNGADSGSARVFSGADGSILYTFDGDTAGDGFGFAVSSAGDVNGDGRADLIVGAPGDDNNGSQSGSARVLSGLDGSILHTFDGDDVDDGFGWRVSGAGDVNGDGRADLIVGTPGDDNNGTRSGSARVFSGLDGSTLYTFDGDDETDELGISVSGAGDVNGDGRADLIVGALADDNNGPDSGSARVLSGLDGGILYTFDGDDTIDLFGWSVSGAGDINGDGRADLIVGSRRDDNNGDESGSARLFSGIDGSILYTFDGDNAKEFFGFSVSGAGDINGDGIDDFVAGTPDGGMNDGGYVRVFVSKIIIDGDYNADGTVDAADYTVWRDSQGATGPDLAADGDNDGDVDADDYAMWRANFGNQAPASLNATAANIIPEPSSIILLGVAALAIVAWQRQR